MKIIYEWINKVRQLTFYLFLWTTRYMKTCSGTTPISRQRASRRRAGRHPYVNQWFTQPPFDLWV